MLFVHSLERSRRNFDGLQRDTSPHSDTLAGLLNGSPATSPDQMYSKVKFVTITWSETSSTSLWLVLYSAYLTNQGPGSGDIREVECQRLIATCGCLLCDWSRKFGKETGRFLEDVIVNQWQLWRFVAQTRSDFQARIINSLYWVPYISLEVTMENLVAHQCNIFHELALFQLQLKVMKVMMYCLFTFV